MATVCAATDEARTRPKVDDLVAQAFGPSVRVADSHWLRQSARTALCRVALEGSDEDGPQSVIVKYALARPLDPRRLESGSSLPKTSPRWRCRNEWASLQFLNSIAPASELAPRIYAGHAGELAIVIEDLGPHSALVPILMGDDPERAQSVLCAYWSRVGEMHGQSFGRAEAFDSSRDQLGAQPELPSITAVTDAMLARLIRICEDFGILPSPKIIEELGSVAGLLGSKTPGWCLSQVDTSPSNGALVGNSVRLIDFEFGRFQHPVVDVVLPALGFMHDIFPYAIPTLVAADMHRAYRNAVAQCCPKLLDLVDDRALWAKAGAWWLLRIVEV